MDDNGPEDLKGQVR